MSKIIEKINEIKEEISKISSTRLKRTQTNELLDKIKNYLEKLEQNAEEKYKKIISKKAKELNEIADKILMRNQVELQPRMI